MMPITSTKNPRIKAVLDLAKARERERRGLFAVEGAREIQRALAAGLTPVEAYWLADHGLSEAGAVIVRDLLGRRLSSYEVSRPVYDRLVVREGSDGILVVFSQPSPPALSSLALPSVPLVLAVEGVEKPGNLGALLRVADGAGVDAVVVLDGTVDPYNPNVIRASLGTVFATPVLSAPSETFLGWATGRGISVYAAALSARSRPHTSVSYAGPSAILLGAESTGLTPFWLTAADHLVQIPMNGIADSLNVATAGAVLLYEAVRQRMS